MNAAERVLRRRVVAWLVIGIVAAATWWPRADGPIDLRWDGGAYYILGTSLATGQGYRLLSEPGNTESSLHAPFVPVLVATYQTVLQTSDPVVVGHALRLTAALCSVAYAIAIFVLLSAYIPRGYALAAAIIAVLQPQYAYFSDALYAETFFGLFTVLFFILQRYRAHKACFLLAGLCAVLAYEARTAGIALLAAWVAESLLRRDYRRAALAFVISIVPIVSWMGWIKAVESSPEYRQPAYAYQRAPYVYFNVSYAQNMMVLANALTPELGPLTTALLLDRVKSNVKALPVSIGQAVSSWTTPRQVALPLAFLVLIGMVLQVRRRQYLMLMYVALSLAAACLTPFQSQFLRYLMPLYPFFALALFQLLAGFARSAKEPGFAARLVPGFARSVPVWIVVGLIGYQEVDDLRHLWPNHHDVAYEQRGQLVEYKLFYYAPLGTAFDQALDWLQRRAALTDVIAATDPQWVYLRTGRKAVLPPFEPNGKTAQQLIDTVPVKYLIVATKPEPEALGLYYRFTSALVRENPSAWDRVWSSPEGSIEIYQRTDRR